jgi:protein gp37
VPFFFKQWGGFFKKRTGRTLDKRTWDEMPESALEQPRPAKLAVIS